MQSRMPFWRSALLAIAFLTSPAGAASLYQDGAGARAKAMGGAGAAVADDPQSALFDNPAALSDLDHLALQLGIDAGFAQGRFSNRANPGAHLDQTGVIGGFAASIPAGPVRFGVGINPDIAARNHWRYRDTPGGADGATTYGTQPHESEILLLRSAVGASWQIHPRLSLGGNVGLLYNENRLRSPYIFQTQRTLRTAKTLLDLQTDGLGWNAQGGVRWRPIDHVTLSLTYVSQSTVETHGSASGNAGVQLGNLGLGAARPDFHYDATVTNVFPQQLSAGVEWKPARRTVLGAQFDWINWADAFDTLPVRLRHGNNADLNGLVGSPRLNDDIPVRWRDQFVARVGLEQGLDDHWSLRAGYAYGNNPVPPGTLTPLTAAITEHTLTAGIGYKQGRVRVDAAFQWELPATGSVGESDLAAGEYSFSSTRVGVEWLGLTTEVEF